MKFNKIIAATAILFFTYGSMRADEALVRLNALQMVTLITSSLTKLKDAIEGISGFVTIRENPQTHDAIAALMPKNIRAAIKANPQKKGEIVGNAFKAMTKVAPYIASQTELIMDSGIDIVNDFLKAIVNPKAKLKNGKPALETIESSLITAKAIIAAFKTLSEIIAELPIPAPKDLDKIADDLMKENPIPGPEPAAD